MKRLGCIAIVGLGLCWAAAAQAQVTVTYSYDAKGRLIAAGYSTGWTASYSYDAVDNRTRMVMGTAGYVGASLSPPVMVAADAPSELDLAALSTNPDLAGKRLISVGRPDKGTLTIVGDKVRYQPNAGQSGIDSFSYTMSNGAVSDTMRMRVAIKGKDDEPADVAKPVEEPGR